MSAVAAPCSVLTALAFLFAPALVQAQAMDRLSRVHVAGGGAFLTSSAYFTGPGNVEFANGNAFAGVLQGSLTVSRKFSVTIAAAHARPEWRLTGVPLIGSVGVPGARLWFGDAALRGHVALGPGMRAPEAFAQAGAGFAHYSVSGTVFGRTIDERATNFALALGAGIALPLAPRVGLEVMAKDYIASFRSVRDLESFGVAGRRAHTVLLLVSARFGI